MRGFPALCMLVFAKVPDNLPAPSCYFSFAFAEGASPLGYGALKKGVAGVTSIAFRSNILNLLGLISVAHRADGD